MEFRLPALSGGINLKDLKHKIQDNQSPDMMNMWYRDYTLGKRWGQKLVTFTDGTNPVTLGTVRAVSKEFEGYVGVVAGTTMYKWDTETDVLTSVGTVASADGVFQEFNGKLYYLDGTEIWEINSSWTKSAVTPYEPVVYINCAPNLSSSTPNEAYNLIGAGFTVWYNGNGSATTYTLPLKSLDATTVKVSVGGVNLTEGMRFTVDRTNGTINFAAGTSPYGAPASGTNNVVITAYKTIAGNKAKIAGCKIMIPFGGETGLTGGTRMFVMGNPSYPRTYWWSDLGAGQSYGMAYFPDDQFEELIQNDDKIVAAAKQFGYLVILKRHSLFTVDYQFDGEEVYFPVREFNSTIGCIAKESVQLIENHIVFLSDNGVYMIVSLSADDEENVRMVSENVNGTAISPGLLSEPSLESATSIDYDRKYWLAVNGKVYLLDYGIKPITSKPANLSWFRFNNINASYWYGNGSLYTFHGTKAAVFIQEYLDFGKPIEAWWESKSFDFGLPNYEKTINQVFPSIRGDTNSSMTVQVFSEKPTVYSKTIDVLSFSWETFDWSLFSWAVQRFSKPYRLKPKLKKVIYCRIKVYDKSAYRDAGISDITIDFTVNRSVKR